MSELITNLISTTKDQKSQKLRLLKIFTFSILGVFAVGLNPNGFKIWSLPFTTINASLEIQEWQSPNFHQMNLQPFLWLLFLLITSFAISRKRIQAYDLLKVLGFTYLALYSQRAIPIFAIVAAPVTTRYLSHAWDSREIKPKWSLSRRFSNIKELSDSPLKSSRVINLVLVSLIFAASIFRIYTLSTPEEVFRNFPNKAVQWIMSYRPDGRIFNSYNWGGYLTWDLSEYPVYIDGRADIYGEEIITEWHQVVKAEDNAMEILDSWGINLILIEPGWPINKELQRSGWQIVYQDKISRLYVRP
jgi:hypothetical protein